ncbi:hypothetical protein [Alteraurantiacibacter aquimixticola]|uniref:hypothetical protein n=1 Tax=Alteraurantiacibacter aquimixticola TaxID=2489173 RepID=UPI00145B1D7E|nr:hypothetical protein [Alteraurantiacibacter aquimixticola]
MLLWLGDSITTDHISLIGEIAEGSPVARWLRENGWDGERFGSYGDFLGNHEVMLRGTFDNPRLTKRIASREGNAAICADGSEASVFDAARSYTDQGTPAVIWAGEGYGCGSARDWAAKGTALLGIRAVIARSFERIHRSNLIAMGILPILVNRDPVTGLSPLSRLSVLGPREPRINAAVTIELAEAGRTESIAGQLDLRTLREVELVAAGGVAKLISRLLS